MGGSDFKILVEWFIKGETPVKQDPSEFTVKDGKLHPFPILNASFDFRVQCINLIREGTTVYSWVNNPQNLLAKTCILDNLEHPAQVLLSFPKDQHYVLEFICTFKINDEDQKIFIRTVPTPFSLVTNDNDNAKQQDTTSSVSSPPSTSNDENDTNDDTPQLTREPSKIYPPQLVANLPLPFVVNVSNPHLIQSIFLGDKPIDCQMMFPTPFVYAPLVSASELEVSVKYNDERTVNLGKLPFLNQQNSISVIHSGRYALPTDKDPLLDACAAGDKNAVTKILESFTDNRKKQAALNSALLAALENERENIVESLLAKGADPNITQHGRSALFIAAVEKENIKLCKKLKNCSAKADFDINTTILKYSNKLQIEEVYPEKTPFGCQCLMRLQGSFSYDTSVKIDGDLEPTILSRTDGTIDIMVPTLKMGKHTITVKNKQMERSKKDFHVVSNQEYTDFIIPPQADPNNNNQQKTTILFAAEDTSLAYCVFLLRSRNTFPLAQRMGTSVFVSSPLQTEDLGFELGYKTWMNIKWNKISFVPFGDSDYQFVMQPGGSMLRTFFSFLSYIKAELQDGNIDLKTSLMLYQTLCSQVDNKRVDAEWFSTSFNTTNPIVKIFVGLVFASLATQQHTTQPRTLLEHTIHAINTVKPEQLTSFSQLCVERFYIWVQSQQQCKHANLLLLPYIIKSHTQIPNLPPESPPMVDESTFSMVVESVSSLAAQHEAAVQFLINVCPSSSSLLHMENTFPDLTEKFAEPIIKRAEYLFKKEMNLHSWINILEGKSNAKPLLTKSFVDLLCKMLRDPYERWDKASQPLCSLITDAKLLRSSADELLSIMVTSSNDDLLMTAKKALLSLIPQKHFQAEIVDKLLLKWFMSYLQKKPLSFVATYDLASELVQRCPDEKMYKSLLAHLMDISQPKKFISDEVLKSSTHMVTLHKDIQAVFTTVAKERLPMYNSTMQSLKRCLDLIVDNCNTVNSLGDKILCCLLDQMKSLNPSESSHSVVAVLKSHNFWYNMFALSKDTAFQHHKLFQFAWSLVRTTHSSLVQQIITRGSLQALISVDDSTILNYCRITSCPSEPKLNLDTIRAALNKHYATIQLLDRFLQKIVTEDTQQYRTELSKQKENDSITLKEIIQGSHWGILSDVLEPAETLDLYAESQIMQKLIVEYKKPTLPSFLKAVPQAISKFHECEAYGNLQYNPPLQRAIKTWEDVNVAREVKILNRIVDANISPKQEQFLQSLAHIQEYEQKCKTLQQLTEMFIAGAKFDAGIRFCTLIKQGSTLMKEFELALQEVIPIFAFFNEEEWALVHVIAGAKDLVHYLREILYEDLRTLIDAVEEHSDQFIREDTVSGFIKTKDYLKPLLQGSYQNPDDLFRMICNYIRKKGHARVFMDKIYTSSENLHGLKRTYKNLANRGEVTREIVRNAISSSAMYTIEVQHSQCKITLDYKKGSDFIRYSLADLHDLRSRALLLLNSERSFDESGKKYDTSAESTFVQDVDLIQSIEDVLLELLRLGHPQYKNFSKKLKKDAPQILESLKADLEELLKAIQNIREKYYFTNFFHSRQLFQLHEWFYSKNLQQCVNLFNYVDPNFDVAFTLSNYKTSSIISQNLKNVGMVLQQVFQSTTLNKPIKIDLGNIKEDSPKPGELFVVATSASVVGVVMSLFAKTKNFPSPCQILFCRPTTTREEIQLILSRCFLAEQNGVKNRLFCIANVENLDFPTQCELVNMILHGQEKSSAFMLALVTSKDDGQQHILEQFRDNLHTVAGLSSDDLAKLFQNERQNVKVVSSDIAGLGKTEFIIQDAFSKKLDVKTIHISGPIDPGKFVAQIANTKVGKHQAVHLDIGPLDDPILLNSLLFEVLILRIASAGPTVLKVPWEHVYIEIGNTIKNNLLDSLPFVNWFEHIHLQFNLKNFVVSTELRSPIQVVCNYLNMDLEKFDIIFSGPKTTAFIHTTEQCHALLQKHFIKQQTEISYTLIHNFLEVAAQQLIMMSGSYYFQLGTLKLMGANVNVRKILVEALVQVAADIAQRSVKSARSMQERAVSKDTQQAHAMVERIQGMLRWADSNHLMVIFHKRDRSSITAVYRELQHVPKHIAELMATQKVKLEDYAALSGEQLWDKLVRICSVQSQKFQAGSYSLTPDNMLKMVLITLRLNARIPVVIMGETGCGKTSLVKFLAKIVEADFLCLNFHAGVAEEDIVKFVTKARTQATLNPKRELWLFLDEINTCDHLGLLNDIICHHMMHGAQLEPNIMVIAACNPYRYRSKKNKTTVAGLDGKVVWDDASLLVYRVHPLPESMMDYLWDYGTLDPNDELSYIRAMISELSSIKYINAEAIAHALSTSQNFVRSREEEYSVSLRDVNRAKILIKWFFTNLRRPSSDRGSSYCQNISDEERARRAVVLGVAHCYHCRFASSEVRKEYRQAVCKALRSHSFTMTEETFQQYLREEQKDYLKRMELPVGTAENTALMENVFVMLVCILNKIPVFVVGKPGCSKSLSMQLINSNLRGLDSKDPWFRTLDQVYVVAYQGSESSTSDGILKVFDKAQKYLEHNPKGVTPVVLLDEVGLAEISKHNPLKVLHSLLEPAHQATPDTAVVGISNWALDAAKMNRAIYLSRPEPDAEDLKYTAESIVEGIVSPHKRFTSRLQGIANAYFKYQREQQHANFHGLRDYYSFVRSYARFIEQEQLSEEEALHYSLQRNFGGNAHGTSTFQKLCTRELSLVSIPPAIPVLDLVKSHLDDTLARHLMLITNRDSAINILQKHLQIVDKKHPVIIYGSKFPEDDSENYNYRVLSRIILCMEVGECLILQDLENIYGSLYDMLNQNYTVVGKKKNCRVALGAHNNPMCQVHDNFRCIILMDQSKIKTADPPFLNRFEKQCLNFEDMLSENQKGMINNLKQWMETISTVNTMDGNKSISLLPEFSEDLLPSLVMLHADETDFDTALLKCKTDLAWIASADGIARTSLSNLYGTDKPEVERWQDIYYKQPHESLQQYLDYAKQNHQQINSIILTYSPIHAHVSALIQGAFKVQVDKLGTFKSERDLAHRVQQYYESEANLLVIQCDEVEDEPHLMLSKFIIDQHASNTKNSAKHVCMIIHLHRDGNDLSHIKFSKTKLPFNFLCGWNMALIDVLEAPDISMLELRGKNVIEIMRTTKYTPEQIIKKVLKWSFLTIKYPNTLQSIQRMQKLLNVAQSNSKFIKLVNDRMMAVLQQQAGNELWQSHIACDLSNILMRGSFQQAIIYEVQKIVRVQVAKIIFCLENHQALETYLQATSQDIMNQWESLFLNDEILALQSIPAASSPECYPMTSHLDHLTFPFSLMVSRFIAETYNGFAGLQDIGEEQLLMICAARVDADLDRYVPSAFMLQYLDLYKRDYLVIRSQNWYEIEEEQRISFLLKLLQEKSEQLDHPVKIHHFWMKNEQELLNSLNLIELHAKVVKQPLRFESVDELQEDIIAQCCHSLSPTEDNINLIGNLSQWQNYTLQVLSKAVSLQNTIAILMLRFFNDFVSLVVPHCKTPAPLHAIAQEASNYENPLTASDFYTFVAGLCSNIKKENPSKEAEEAICRFLCSYIGRCFDCSNDDEELEQLFIKTLFDQTHMPSVRIVMLRLVWHNEEVLSTLWKDHSDLSPSLQTLNSALTSHQTPLDNDVAILICDLIQMDLLQNTVHEDSIQHLGEAIAVIEDEKSTPLQALSAVAFVKACFEYLLEKYFSGDLHKHEAILTLSSVLQRKGPRTQALSKYFLKLLRTRLSLPELLEEKQKLTWLPKDWSWKQVIKSKLGFNPFSTIPEHKAARLAFVSLSSADKTAFKVFLADNNNAKLKNYYSMFCEVANELYFPLSLQELSGSEKLLQTALLDTLPKNNIAKLLSLFAKNEFPINNMMRLNPNTANIDAISVTAHFIFVAASYSNNPFTMYLYDPLSVKDDFIIAAEAKNLVRSQQRYWRYNCQCGYRYIMLEPTNLNSNHCPQCKKQFEQLTEVDTSTSANTEPHRGYLFNNLQGHNQTVRSISPASFRILHWIVHACLLGSSVAGFAKGESLSSLLNSTSYDVTNDIENAILSDWEALSVILNCTSEQLCILLHKIAAEIFVFLGKGTGPLKTPQQREELENAIATQCIQPYLEKIPQTVLMFKQLLCVDGVEDEIEERLATPTTTEYQNANLPKLLRKMSPKSFKGLQATVLNNPKLISSHPFLDVFLRHADNFRLLKHLLPVIKWTNFIISNFNRKFKRTDAAEKTIFTVLQDNNFSQEDFEAFQLAWKEIAPRIPSIQADMRDEVKEIDFNRSPFSLCCVERKDNGLFVCSILEELVGIQNSLLEEVLVAASKSKMPKSFEKAPNLQGLRTVAVQEATEVDIVNIDESRLDSLAHKLGFQNLEVGLGEQVEYDLDKIELDIFSEFFKGKSFLSAINLNEFCYQMELFHHSSSILTEIRQKIAQVPTLPVSLPNLDVMEAMASLEIAFSYLKRTGGQPTLSLVEYCNIWNVPELAARLGKHTQLELQHVVALYEHLEEQLTDVLLKDVSKTYQRSLTSELVKNLNEALERIKIDDLTHAVRKFVVRFLSGSEDLNADNHLSMYLTINQGELWGGNIPQHFEDVFPEDLTVSQAYHLLQFLREQQKVNMIMNFADLQKLRAQKQTTEQKKQANNKIVPKKPDRKINF